MKNQKTNPNKLHIRYLLLDYKAREASFKAFFLSIISKLKLKKAKNLNQEGFKLKDKWKFYHSMVLKQKLGMRLVSLFLFKLWSDQC